MAGICANGNFYVLQDKSLRGSPDTWAKEAVHAFQSNNADRLIAEVNNGGDLVERVVRTIDRQTLYSGEGQPRKDCKGRAYCRAV